MPRASRPRDQHEEEIARALLVAIDPGQVLEAAQGRVTVSRDYMGFTLKVGVQQREGARSVWASLVFTDKDAPRTLGEQELHAKRTLELVALGRRVENAGREVLRKIYGPRAIIG